MPDALLSPAGEGGHLVTLVDDGVVVVLLRPEPGCQLEVVAWLQSVDAEVALDQLRSDGHGRAELRETVDQLLSHVGQRHHQGPREGDDGHGGVAGWPRAVLALHLCNYSVRPEQVKWILRFYSSVVIFAEEKNLLVKCCRNIFILSSVVKTCRNHNFNYEEKRVMLKRNYET